MKKILLTITLLFSLSAQADFIQGLVVGSAMSSNTVVNHDKYSRMIDLIDDKLPYKGTFSKKEFISFSIPQKVSRNRK